MYMAHNAIYISCTSVLDLLQPSAINFFPKKAYFLYNYCQLLGDTCDFLVRHIESWILFMVTLVIVIHKCVMSAILPLHVWDFKSLSRLVAFLSMCFLQILKMVDQDFCVYVTVLLLLDLTEPAVISVFLITHLKDINYNCMPSCWIILSTEVILYVALYTKKLNIYKFSHLYTRGITFQLF